MVTFKKIKYIGPKEEKKDTVCGTGLIWSKEEVLDVESNVAVVLCRFKEIWIDVTKDLKDNKDGTKPTAPKKSKPAGPVSQARKMDEESEKEDGDSEEHGNGGAVMPPMGLTKEMDEKSEPAGEKETVVKG